MKKKFQHVIQESEMDKCQKWTKKSSLICPFGRFNQCVFQKLILFCGPLFTLPAYLMLSQTVSLVPIRDESKKVKYFQVAIHFAFHKENVKTSWFIKGINKRIISVSSSIAGVFLIDDCKCGDI